MYGRHGKLVAQAGKRDELVAILTRASDLVSQLPGCHLYVVAEDLADESTIWVFEVWEDREAHAASLQDDSVKSLIGAAMPLIGRPPEGATLNVVAGHGLNP